MAASVLSWGVAATALASGSRTVLPRSPLSARIPSAQAARPGAGASSASRSQSPAITVLPNVAADGTTSSPVNEDPLTADPVTSTHLMSGGNDYSCSSSLQGFYNSDDGGATWRHTCMPVVHDSGCGDPAVGYDRNGVAYTAGIDCGSVWNIILRSSTNNGMTWGSAHVAVSSIQGGLTDKEWMEVDTSATSPHVNCIYISLTDFNSSATASRITVSHSCNGGTSFSTVAVDSLQSLPSLDQFSDLTVGADGTVWVSWMRCHTSGAAGDCGGTSVTMYNSKSTDGGMTWTAPTKIADVNTAPDSCFCAYYGNMPGTSERLSNIPVIDHDASTGKLWATFYNYTGGATHAELTSSADGGLTWTTPAVINPSGNAGWMWTATNDAGRIAVSFMFSQTTGTYLAATVLTMNGTTFTKKKTSLTGAMLFANDGFGGGFIGDYTGGIWTGNTYHQSWMDTRSGGVSSDMTGGLST